MGYFSNGTEGLMFKEAWCFRCAHWKDEGDGRGPGCPVMDAHFIYAHEECNSKSNAKNILEMLIDHKIVTANDGFGASRNECKMFLPGGDETA